MRRSALSLVCLLLPGCAAIADLFAKDEPVEFDVIFTSMQLVLEPRDYRGRPANADFGVINNGPFMIFLTPVGFRSPDDASVPDSVLNTMIATDDHDIPVLPSHSTFLDVSYASTPATWVDGVTTVLFDVEIGAFDPDMESGSGAPVPRRRAFPDAWVSEVRTVEVQVTWICDVDDDGDIAIACGGTDCADENANTGAGFPEICDNGDNDCDGVDDEDATDAIDWFEDIDNDGYGLTNTALRACYPPTRAWAALSGDCDDADEDRHPNALEVCGDLIDNDCDGAADDGCP